MNSAFLRVFTATVILSLATGIYARTKPRDKAPIHAELFAPGDFDSKFYRIPAIVTAADGTLIAVADKRIENNNDLPGRIDVVARRSTDGGKTWGPFITVAEHDSIGGCGDPAIVIDRNTGDLIVIYNHGNGFWQKSPTHITLKRSHDNGLTWSDPEDITEQILTTDLAAPQTVKCNGAFASSGRALQLDNGRILFALVSRVNGYNLFPIYAVYSDDGGKTWMVSDKPAAPDGDESKFTQLPNGDVLMSIRNRYKDKRYDNSRLFARSTDNGATWSAPVVCTDIIDPACNGDLITVSYNGKDYVLQSLPASPDKREKVAIYASEDGGKTFPYKKIVVEGPSAYSSLTQLPDGNIGILTEEDPDGDGAYTLCFRSVPMEQILTVN